MFDNHEQDFHIASALKSMRMKHDKWNADHPRNPHEPRKREQERRAIVQCECFRCVGLQKSDGRWVGLGGEDLDVREVISWVKR